LPSITKNLGLLNEMITATFMGNMPQRFAWR
jgi:hypothetical protein